MSVSERERDLRAIQKVELLRLGSSALLHLKLTIFTTDHTRVHNRVVLYKVLYNVCALHVLTLCRPMRSIFISRTTSFWFQEERTTTTTPTSISS